MLLRLETLVETKLVGQSTKMSFLDNRTFELWRNFMSKRSSIASIGTKLYSVERYSEGFFDNFDPEMVFEKWAAVAVSSFDNIPSGFSALTIPAGTYAVFLYKGPASLAAETYRYIFNEWMPASGFKIDERPHLAIMSEKYHQESPDSEEEIWIPVRPV